MSGPHRNIALLAGCLGLLLLAACNSATGRRWQRVFFDGVPPERSAATIPAAAGPGTPAGAAVGASDLPVVGTVVHRPYANHDCGACHQSVFSQKLVAEVGDLCQLCHKQVFAGATFRHAPADSGQCVVCHNPHQSDQKALLVLPGRALCLECHDEKDPQPIVEHERAGKTACQVCHNPHGSDRRFFLRGGWQAAAGLTSPGSP